MTFLRRYWQFLLLGFVPLAVGLEMTMPENHTAIFGASVLAILLLLSTIGLVVPAVFHRLAGGGSGVELELDTEIAVVLFATYCASLIFTLRTHRSLYGPVSHGHAGSHSADSKSEVRNSVIMLFVATAAVAVVSELLVTSVSATARDLGMTNLFVGVVIVALVGNAASISPRWSSPQTTRWTPPSASPSDPRRRSRCSSHRRWSSSAT